MAKTHRGLSITAVNTAKFNFFILFPFILVLFIMLSNISRIDGKIVKTNNILIRAPLLIKLHIEPIISILEYIPTPKVAAKKQAALTRTECPQ